jgi:zinc transporter ZupT
MALASNQQTLKEVINMDIGNVTFVGLVVITIVGALKDAFPTMTNNMTRVAALVIGGIIGLLAQVGLLAGVDATVVTGIMAGVAAVGTVTVADRVGMKAARLT